MHNSEIAQRVYKMSADTKIIMTVVHPTNRQVSRFAQIQAHGIIPESMTFEDYFFEDGTFAPYNDKYDNDLIRINYTDTVMTKQTNKSDEVEKGLYYQGTEVPKWNVYLFTETCNKL